MVLIVVNLKQGQVFLKNWFYQTAAYDRAAKCPAQIVKKVAQPQNSFAILLSALTALANAGHIQNRMLPNLRRLPPCLVRFSTTCLFFDKVSGAANALLSALFWLFSIILVVILVKLKKFFLCCNKTALIFIMLLEGFQCCMETKQVAIHLIKPPQTN